MFSQSININQYSYNRSTQLRIIVHQYSHEFTETDDGGKDSWMYAYYLRSIVDMVTRMLFLACIIAHQREDKNLVHGKTAASSSNAKVFEVWRSRIPAKLGSSASSLSVRRGWQTFVSMSWRLWRRCFAVGDTRVGGDPLVTQVNVIM
jgi:hypothetical protein